MHPVLDYFCIAALFEDNLLCSAGNEYIVNGSVRFGSLQAERGLILYAILCRPDIVSLYQCFDIILL